MAVDDFTRAAMALSSDERALLAGELLSSLEPTRTEDPAEIETAWATESERRARQVLDGEVDGHELAPVLDRIRRRLHAEG